MAKCRADGGVTRAQSADRTHRSGRRKPIAWRNARFRSSSQEGPRREDPARRTSGSAQPGTILTIYADSSFFVSLYVPNQNFKKAQRLAPRHAEIWLTPLHRPEWGHAVTQHLLQGRISDAQAQAFRDHLERDRRSRFWMEVDFPEMAFERCIQLVRQVGSRVPMGTLDTLHVACALELGAERFFTFDERQAKLARAVGLKVT